MDFTNIFRLVNLGVGGLTILGGITNFFHTSFFNDYILGVYLLIFGLCIIGLELLPQVPPYLPRYASFLFSFLGRGIFYIFVGSIILAGGTLRIITGSLVGIVGVGYCALEFAPQIEPPSNMREGDNAGWGAEQV